MANNFNTDYLQYDAESIKELVKRKLSENTDFTDYIFDDSNMTILIDVFAAMFESLSFYLNHGSTEAF